MKGIREMIRADNSKEIAEIAWHMLPSLISSYEPSKGIVVSNKTIVNPLTVMFEIAFEDKNDLSLLKHSFLFRL